MYACRYVYTYSHAEKDLEGYTANQLTIVQGGA